MIHGENAERAVVRKPLEPHAGMLEVPGPPAAGEDFATSRRVGVLVADPFENMATEQLTRRERRRIERAPERSELRNRLRRFFGLVVAVAFGAALGWLAWWLPSNSSDDGLGDVPSGMRSAALRALDDARTTFFDTGIEQFLVTSTYVDSITRGDVPDACPVGTEFAARIRARTLLWIPYDDALWCGSASGRGLLLTRQALPGFRPW